MDAYFALQNMQRDRRYHLCSGKLEFICVGKIQKVNGNTHVTDMRYKNKDSRNSEMEEVTELGVGFSRILEYELVLRSRDRRA